MVQQLDNATSMGHEACKCDHAGPHTNGAVVAIYTTHDEAEAAVRELQKSGYDMKHLSIVGKNYSATEDVIGYYNVGDRMKSWGIRGAFWGGIWGMLFGSAFFLIPGVGPILAAGPIVSWIVGVLETAAVVGGMSAIGSALFSIGIPKDSILSYETHIKAGDYLLVAHGMPESLAGAEATLAASGHHGIYQHCLHTEKSA